MKLQVGLVALLGALAVGPTSPKAPYQCDLRRPAEAEPPGFPLGGSYQAIRARLPRSAGCDGVDEFEACSFRDSSGYVNYIFDHRLGTKRARRADAGWLPFGVTWSDTPAQVSRKLKTVRIWLEDGVAAGRPYVTTNGCLMASTRETFRLEFLFGADGERLSEVVYSTLD